MAQIWGPAKGHLAPSHRLLTHSLASHVRPASPPSPPLTITSFISCCDITPPLPGPPAGNELCWRSRGGKCGRTRTHLCPPTQQPVSPSPPPPPPRSVVKVGRGSRCRPRKSFSVFADGGAVGGFLCFNGVPNIRDPLFRVRSVCGLTHLQSRTPLLIATPRAFLLSALNCFP